MCVSAAWSELGRRAASAVVLQLPLSPVRHFPSLAPLRPPLSHPLFLFSCPSVPPPPGSSYTPSHTNSCTYLLRTNHPLSLYQPLFSSVTLPILLFFSSSLSPLQLFQSSHMWLRLPTLMQRRYKGWRVGSVWGQGWNKYLVPFSRRDTVTQVNPLLVFPLFFVFSLHVNCATLAPIRLPDWGRSIRRITAKSVHREC